VDRIVFITVPVFKLVVMTFAPEQGPVEKQVMIWCGVLS